MPGKTQPSREVAFFRSEISKSTNIKNRVNRQSVIDAMKSASEALKNYKNFGPNGLALFAGWYI